MRHFFALDTIIDVTVYSNGMPVERDLDTLQGMILAMDSGFSISQTGSEVYRINHRADSLVAVSGGLKTILDFCRDELDRSGGLFDITVEPLKYLYGLESHQTRHHVPTARQLDSARAFVGFGRVRFVNDSCMVLPRGMHVDLGGIAKGYVLQKSRWFLAGKGYASFLINAGGDLIAHGTKPDGDPWNVGIQDPRNERSLIARLRVTGANVFTSGDYQRYFIENGKRYHHLFNPKTGLPGNFNRSATVVGEDPLAIDAAVKTAFLMPADKGLHYLQSRGMMGLMVDSGGGVWASESMRKILAVDSTVAVQYR